MSKKNQAYENEKKPKQPIKYHIAKYSEGWASGGSSSYRTYSDSFVIPLGNKSFMLGKKQVDFKSYKTGIFTSEFWIFSMFSIFTLFFVILTHSFDQVPLFPRIMTIMFLLITLTPLVFSLIKSKRRAIFKLDSSDFITLYFDNNEQRDCFLSNYFSDEPVNDDGFFADVTLNAYDLRNEKQLANAKVSLKDNKIIISNNYQTEVFDNYLSKSRDLMWQLYPFASVFIALPIFMIVSSVLSNSFEEGMLFTLVFLVAGLLIMMVPSIMSRGNLLILTSDGYIRVALVDPKKRKQLILLLNQVKRSKKDQGDLSFIKQKFNAYQVYNTEKPKFILRFWVATFIFSAVVVGVCFSGDLTISAIMIYMSFVFYSFFLIMCKDDLRENFVIRNRYKRLWESTIITGKVSDVLIEDFNHAGKYFFNVCLHVSYVNEDNMPKVEKFNRIMVRNYPNLTENDTVTLALNDKTVSLLFDNSQEFLSIPNEVIKDQDEIISLLKKVTKFSNVSSNTKIFQQARWLYYLAYGLASVVMTGLVVLFINLAINGADEITRIVSIVLLGIFGLILSVVVNRLVRIILKEVNNKKIINTGERTKGVIVCLNERRVRRNNSNSSDTYIHYISIKYVYLNTNEQLQIGYANESFYSNSSGYGIPSIKYFTVLDVYYDDKKSVVTLS